MDRSPVTTDTGRRVYGCRCQGCYSQTDIQNKINFIDGLITEMSENNCDIILERNCG